MLRNGLIDAGVDPDCIEIIETEEEANVAALSMARGGDLLLVLADNVPRTWKQIIYFEPDEEVMAHAPSSKAMEIPQEFFGEFDYDDNLELIRDERGVRIARDAED